MIWGKKHEEGKEGHEHVHHEHEHKHEGGAMHEHEHEHGVEEHPEAPHHEEMVHEHEHGMVAHEHEHVHPSGAMHEHEHEHAMGADVDGPRHEKDVHDHPHPGTDVKDAAKTGAMKMQSEATKQLEKQKTREAKTSATDVVDLSQLKKDVKKTKKY